MSERQLWKLMRTGKYTDVISLLESFTDLVISKNKDGQTLLHYACYYLNKSFDLVRYIIDNNLDKIDINVKDNYGNTALSISCCNVNSKTYGIIKYMIKRCTWIDIDIKNGNGDTALNICMNEIWPYEENSKLIKLLIKLGADVSGIKAGRWLYIYDEEFIEFLLRCGANTIYGKSIITHNRDVIKGWHIDCL